MIDLLPSQAKTACIALLQPTAHAWVRSAEGTPADPVSLPNGTAIPVGLIEQTAEKAPQNPVQVEQQPRNDTQINHREAAPTDAPADGHAVNRPTAHMALLKQQVLVILSAPL